jgi:hypothetical protein
MGMRVMLAVGSVIVCAALTACSSPSNPPNDGEPTKLTDSPDEAFAFACSPSGCTISANALLPRGCDGWTLFFTGRVMTVCASLGGGTVDGLCRPLTCSTDSDCPIFETGRGAYLCKTGICQDLSSQVYLDDVVPLCLAGSPRGGGCGDLFASAMADPAVAAATAAATAACGSQTCDVPSQCQQL